MVFLDRWDGERVRGLNPFQKIFPYIMPTRNGAAVYFSEDVDVEAALSLARSLNGSRGGRKYHLFHVVMAALVHILVKKEHLNRFVSGRSLYQRKHIAISFIVKKRLTEEARETDAKIFFSDQDTLASVADKIDAAVEKARSQELSPDEKEMYVLSKIPGAYALASALFRLLNRLNIAPRSMLKSDPLFTSVYVANLASLNLTTPFHHLYEWGTASLFFVMGRLERRKELQADGTVRDRHVMNVKVTLDERISEGLYFAHAVDLFKRIMAEPAVLLHPPRDWELVNGKPMVSAKEDIRVC